MRSSHLAAIFGLFALVACNEVKQPNDENFRKAIDQYLAKHGRLCEAIGGPFPIDIPRSQLKEAYGVVPQVTALEQAGLVHGVETTAVVHSMLDPLRGPTPPQPVKEYQLTEEGKRYLQDVLVGLDRRTAFCYGQKRVDSIVKWTEPATAGAYSQTEVTYTYKIEDSVSWAERPDIQNAFPDIGATLREGSKGEEIVGLQLTNHGWEVPER